MSLSKFLQLPPNIYLFKYAPFWVSTRFLQLMGTLYYIVNSEERKLIEKNVMMVFKNPDEAAKILKKSFEGIFLHYSEKLLMAYKDLDILEREIGGSIEYSGIDYLDDAFTIGGVLLVTGHFGAVEFMPLVLSLRNYPISIVVTFQTEQLRENLMARAAKRDVELIDGHGGRVMQMLIQSLKRGRIVVTECDEVDEWRTKGNSTIDAFGGKIMLDRTLEVLYRRSGASILEGFMIRTDKGYKFTVEKLEETKLNTENETVSVMILKKFEQIVMLFPDQWYQWKKFHKMRPEIL
ncbi:lysophospholipid acyltransferase family protein [Candidatus Latescibacterota bacterium]